MRALPVLAGLAACWGSQPGVAPAPAPPSDKIIDEVVVRDAPFAGEVAVDDRHVYWFGSDRHGNDAEVWRAEKRPGSTGVRLAVASTNPSGLVLDARAVYWGDDQQVFVLAKDTDKPRALAKLPDFDSVWGLALLPDEVVVASYDSDERETSVRRIDRASGQVHPAVKVEGEYKAMAATPSKLVVGTEVGVFEVDRQGFVATIDKPMGGAVVLAVASPHVYFGTGGWSGEIQRMPGSRAEPDLPVVMAPAMGEPSAMAIDARFIYWCSMQIDNAPNAIYRIAKHDGWRELVTKVGECGSLVVDNGYLYWTDPKRGRVMRRRLQ